MGPKKEGFNFQVVDHLGHSEVGKVDFSTLKTSISYIIDTKWIKWGCNINHNMCQGSVRYKLCFFAGPFKRCFSAGLNKC